MLTTQQISDLRPYGWDLRAELVTETGETLDAWTTIAPANPKDWPISTRSCRLAVLSGEHRGQVFDVSTRAARVALGH